MGTNAKSELLELGAGQTPFSLDHSGGAGAGGRHRQSELFLRPVGLLSAWPTDVVPLFIMALGMTFAIYIGGIDLSAQSSGQHGRRSSPTCLSVATFGIGVAVVCIAVGADFRSGISGYVTTRLLCALLRLHPGDRGLYRPVDPRNTFPASARSIDGRNRLRDASFGWMFGNTAGACPHELVIGGCCCLALAWFLQTRTTFGRVTQSQSALANLAAVASGLNVDRVKIIAFALSGAFAGIAGLMFSVKLSGGDRQPSQTASCSLAIVAVLVGGTPLTGGVGGVINTAHWYPDRGMVIRAVHGLPGESTPPSSRWCSAMVLIVAIALHHRPQSNCSGVVK